MERRALLSSLGVVVASSLTGCSTTGNEELPAGSLRFANQHDLPHSIGLTVTGIGSEPTDSTNGDGPLVTGDVSVRPSEQKITASTSLDPNETQTFESVFTEPVWYGIEFTIDGSTSDDTRTAYHPAPPGKDSGRVLEGSVSESGYKSWGISGTDNMGTFANSESSN